MSSTTDPAAYLRSLPPFDGLPADLFADAARAVQVSFHPSGDVLVRAGGAPLRHLHVIRKGAVRLESEGRILQALEEGEIFGHTSLLGHEAALDVIVVEDLVSYRLPAETFDLLMSDARFARHFASRAAERLQASVAGAALPAFRADLAVEVGAIAPRAPVWIAPETTAGEAARLMRRERISSVLVRGDTPGILTDRDLRGRVLAEGRGPGTPARDVRSAPLRTVPATTPVYAAWARLLEAGVHHLPLTRGGEIVGIVTSTDFLRHSAPGPIALLRTVERLPSRDALRGWADRVADLSFSLLASGLDAITIAGFVARLNDALVRRILAWAEEDLGPPPAPYAWVVLGSEGRMEQTLLTDQDNALVYADGGQALPGWFERLAERAGQDLVAAGFPECPGGYMARRWLGPLAEWVQRFRGWIEVPNPQALLASSIFFDFRRVGGALEVGALDALLLAARHRPAFLRLFAGAAMATHPPPRLLLRLRGEASRVDLKAHGLSPVVYLARCYGLEAGSLARTTLERLDAAARAGLVAEEEHATVAEAFRFFLGLRLRLQLEARARRAPMPTDVALADLTALERTRLKEALRAIATWHDHARHRYQIDPAGG